MIIKLICALILTTVPLNASHFYALLIGDTLNDSIGKSVKYDISRMKKEVTQIARYTKQELHLILLQGENATTENLLIQLENIHPGPDDTVLFYQSSHGCRTPWKTEPWPILVFDNSRTAIHFESVNDILLNKNPRLLVSFVDCCNSVPEGLDDPVQIPEGAIRAKDNKKLIAKAYKKLFVSSHGAIIASSSEPGQTSVCTNLGGGIFTTNFLDALKMVGQGTIKADWSSLLKSTSKKTQMRAKNLNYTQTPQFVILN